MDERGHRVGPAGDDGDSSRVIAGEMTVARLTSGSYDAFRHSPTETRRKHHEDRPARRSPARHLDCRPGATAPGARPEQHGRRQLRGQRLQLPGHPEPASRREHGLDRGDDVDGCPRCPGGRQDHGHRPHRRCRTQRPMARHRQAQPCAALQLRRHRPRAGRRPLRSDRQAGARRQHRSAQRTHDQPRYSQPAPGDIRGAADRCGAQPQDARFSQHHLHRRQRRKSGRTARRGREAEREVRRRSDRGTRAGVLRLQLRDPLHGLPRTGRR